MKRPRKPCPISLCPTCHFKLKDDSYASDAPSCLSVLFEQSFLTICSQPTSCGVASLCP